ncbi:hypothetical protein BGZ95_010937 [Linnemannia exigua]|uniref:Uncharacterized protein n=1 Tax=Linnemannia exigua TaxID=604196 RepID=A0AAD4DAL7_9FUNG|nr:hypothetical protein BGZ95_010937 [Linnemannia exigua]
MSSALSPSRKSRRIKANNAAAESEQPTEDPSKTIQRLQDELEELQYAKERVDGKVTQLEERAQFLEADTRLSASIAAKELMDLKEKNRQLEIDLSLAVDGRDVLEQEKSDRRPQASDREVLDEANQLSVQLKEAWLRISTMKSAQDETVKRLFKAEEANLKLTADVSKAESQYSCTKLTLADEQKRWTLQKEEYMGEIDSLKAKLMASSPGSEAQVMDWEQDKKRMRDSIKHERAVWDKEKKGLMDQIASLKIKATALHIQKAPPPEWVLEKHQLTDQCSTLQSRVAILESDRTVSGNQHKAQVAKLERKIVLLREKLVEVMKHAQEIEEKVKEDAKQALSGMKKAAALRARRTKRTWNKETDSEIESETEAVELKKPSVAPSRPVRSARSKSSGSTFKKVNYNLDNETSSEDSLNQDQEEDDDDEDDEEEEEEEDVDEETEVQEDHEMGDQRNATGGSNPSAEADSAGGSNQDHGMEVDERAASPSKTGTRRSISGRGRKAVESDDPESSDSEFEPPKKVASKARGRSANKKQTSPAPDTATKKPNRSTKSKSKESTGSSSGVKMDPKRMVAAAEITPLSPESMADTPTSTSSSVLAGQKPASLTPGSTSTPADGSQTSTQKIKKKRRLLTGKGLDDLGDILNGPGMTALASPSKGLQFLPNKTKLLAGRTTLLGGDRPPAPKEALNAIKMAFTLPKARNFSPTRDEK